MSSVGVLVCFVTALVVVSLIAHRRGHSGAAFFFGMLIGGIAFGYLVNALGGSSTDAGVAAFILTPAIGLVIAFTTGRKEAA